MKKTYTGFLRSAYHAPKRRINALGRNIDFINGVAYGIPEDQAIFLEKRNIVSSIVLEVEEAVGLSPAEVVEEVVEVEPEVVEPEVVEPEPEPEAVEPEPEPEELMEEVEEVLDISSLTAEDVQALYDEHGTWGSVADFLGVSPATLKKYRESLGL